MYTYFTEKNITTSSQKNDGDYVHVYEMKDKNKENIKSHSIMHVDPINLSVKFKVKTHTYKEFYENRKKNSCIIFSLKRDRRMVDA